MSERPPSHLFYQTRRRRPVLDQARGVHIWDEDGKRYLDGSSGAMVCNIGHSNENVLEAMRRQMEKSTFGYPAFRDGGVGETRRQDRSTVPRGARTRVFRLRRVGGG